MDFSSIFRYVVLEKTNITNLYKVILSLFDIYFTSLL